VQRYLCSVLEMDRPRCASCRRSSARVGSGLVRNTGDPGGAGARAEAFVRLVLTRQQMYGLGYRPAMISRSSWAQMATERSTYRAWRGDGDIAIRGVLSAGTGRACSTNPPARNTRTSLRAHLATRATCAPQRATASMRWNAQWTNSRRPQARPRRASAQMLFGARSAHRTAYSSKSLRECYRQGAEAFGWAKRDPEPRSMRDGTERVGWGMATAYGRRCRCRSRCASCSRQWPCEVSCATSDIGTGTYTIMTQVAAEMLGLPLDSVTVKLGDSSLPQSPVEAVLDRRLGLERIVTPPTRCARTAASGKADAEFAACGRDA